VRCIKINICFHVVRHFDRYIPILLLVTVSKILSENADS